MVTYGKVRNRSLSVESDLKMMSKEEAISHIVSSTNYWKGDSIDNSYYLNNLGLETAFRYAVEHVKNSHGVELSEDDINIAKGLVGLR